MSISRFPPRRQQRIFAFPPPCGRATAAFPGHPQGNRGCGCRDCVLPSSAPDSGRPRSPARKLVRRRKASLSAQRRGDLKEGVSPSFIVSIRGVKRGKKSKSSPSCVVLFPPFSWTSKRKGSVSCAVLRIRSGHLSANGFCGKVLGRNRNLPPLVSFSFPLSLGQARERGTFPRAVLRIG